MALEIIREEILKTAGEHSLRRLSPRHVLYAYTYTCTRTYISVQRRGFAFVHRSMAVNLPRLVGQTHNSAANGGKKRKKIHAAAKSPFPAIVNFINGQISVFIVIWYRARSRAENKGRRIKTVVRLPFDYTLGRETWAENRLKTRGCDRDCSPLYPRDAALSSASIDDLDPWSTRVSTSRIFRINPVSYQKVFLPCRTFAWFLANDSPIILLIALLIVVLKSKRILWYVQRLIFSWNKKVSYTKTSYTCQRMLFSRISLPFVKVKKKPKKFDDNRSSSAKVKLKIPLLRP